MTEIYCEAKKHLHFAGPPLDCGICRWEKECVIYGRLNQARQLILKKPNRFDFPSDPFYINALESLFQEVLGVLGEDNDPFAEKVQSKTLGYHDVEKFYPPNKEPEKCIYRNILGKCWALKDNCNPDSSLCDYREDWKVQPKTETAP